MWRHFSACELIFTGPLVTETNLRENCCQRGIAWGCPCPAAGWGQTYSPAAACGPREPGVALKNDVFLSSFWPWLIKQRGEVRGQVSYGWEVGVSLKWAGLRGRVLGLLLCAVRLVEQGGERGLSAWQEALLEQLSPGHLMSLPAGVERAISSGSRKFCFLCRLTCISPEH